MPPWMTAPNLAPAPLPVAVVMVAALGAFGVGWTVWRLLGWSRRDGGPALLAAGGLGLVLMGYAVLALGLLGLLSPGTLVAVPLVFLLASAASLGRVLRRLRETVSQVGRAVAWSPNRALYAAALVWLALTLLGGLGPADARDWDGLSEHLAQAKTYLRDGRVHPLWYDHHSQFPATMVMLYSLGLALGGQGAAKLFHWTFALMSLLAVRHLARRHLTASAGGPALAVLATTPLVGWLATVGYVDLSSVFFCLVTANYLLSWREKGQGEDLVRAGLMAGAGMTVKMQGLFTFGVFLLALLFWAWHLRRGLRPVLVYVAVAGALASPWYIKTWVITGNPVYPFAYGLFGGKQWSAEQARPYAYHHAGFGYGKLPPERQWQQLSAAAKHLSGPRNPLNLFVTPFTLTLFPEYYAPRQPRLTAMVMLGIGPLWLMLLPLLVLVRRKKPAAVGWLVGIFALFYLLWFETTQLERYLLPWLALLAPVAGLAVAWMWKAPRPVGT
ncbi:MAG: glycosyltransferase family 39 protein, partial [Armatimonadetes bacterium]|nr:glycosyltransferase family 39 protein [Armatimonadota bacterium]